MFFRRRAVGGLPSMARTRFVGWCRWRHPFAPKKTKKARKEITIRMTAASAPGVELVSAGPPQARHALAVRALVCAVALIVAVVALVGSSSAVAPAGLLSWSTAFDDGYGSGFLYPMSYGHATRCRPCGIWSCHSLPSMRALTRRRGSTLTLGTLSCLASAERAY